MSKRGEEFESDIVTCPIPDPTEKDDLVDDDYQSDDFENDDDGNIALGVDAASGGDCRELGENFNRKKRKRTGGRQRLTQERIQRLDKIGFQWVVSNSNTKSWEERFENLKEYQQYHGTTRVPRSSGTLGEWVHMQVEFQLCSSPVRMCFVFLSHLHLLCIKLYYIFIGHSTISAAFTIRRTRPFLPLELHL